MIDTTEPLVFEYKGQKVLQHIKYSGEGHFEYWYECNGKNYHSIYELDIYLDPESVKSRKKK